MMSESFMTVEGDRSGTNTPSRRDKSQNRLIAAETNIHALIAGFESMDVREILQRIAEIRTSLDAAEMLVKTE